MLTKKIKDIKYQKIVVEMDKLNKLNLGVAWISSNDQFTIKQLIKLHYHVSTFHFPLFLLFLKPRFTPITNWERICKGLRMTVWRSTSKTPLSSKRKWLKWVYSKLRSRNRNCRIKRRITLRKRRQLTIRSNQAPSTK